MTQLFLKYRTADGELKRAEVNGEEFTVGRHSECSLRIADSRLSRKHLKISKIGDFFVANDLGSSNGSRLNGVDLVEPIVLKDQDRLELGGFEISIELLKDGKPIGSQQPIGQQEPIGQQQLQKPAQGQNAVSAPFGSPEKISSKDNAVGSSTEKSKGIPLWAILAGPAAALVLVGVVIIAVVIFSSRPASTAPGGDDELSQITGEDDTTAERKDKSGKRPEDDAESGSEPQNVTKTDEKPEQPSSSDNQAGTTPAADQNKNDETSRVEIAAANFLRKIALNDPKHFLTTEQTSIVQQRIKLYAGSASIAENIKSAKRSANELRTLATSKNLKPLFLAVAAMAKLGKSRGDVLSTARSMADVLDKLTIQLNNEFANDCLLTIAAYDQGERGETTKLRDTLQKLANETSESSRTIRTIWFLKKRGLITDAEFNFAIDFIAIGAITQNPQAFGVNTEALDL
ncbi:MAG TPA: FHA domain-containing protein [Pyrinomonadaceae bacterium]|nr:FHA domain-containing protein [Pyrinomonadaceae bacterium]